MFKETVQFGKGGLYELFTQKDSLHNVQILVCEDTEVSHFHPMHMYLCLYLHAVYMYLLQMTFVILTKLRISFGCLWYDIFMFKRTFYFNNNFCWLVPVSCADAPKCGLVGSITKPDNIHSKFSLQLFVLLWSDLQFKMVAFFL